MTKKRKTTPRIERRFAPLSGVELREDGDSLTFRGTAAVFDSITDLGPFREQVAQEAFNKTIKEADVRFLFNHEPDSVMARTVNGTLELRALKHGLDTTATLDPADWDVQRIEPKLRSGNVSQMSFAFRVIVDEWDDEPDDGGKPLRTLREVALYDVSAVTFPAYEDTDAALRDAMSAGIREVAVSVGIEVDGDSRELPESTERRGPIPAHDTAVTEGPWDGPAAVAAMANEADMLRYCHAWVDSDGDPDAKSSYKFPHHREEGGPAILAAVRNALARLAQANIPDGDRAGVERHLRRHLDAQEQDSHTDSDEQATEPPTDSTDESREEHSDAAARRALRRKRVAYLEEIIKDGHHP